MGVGGDTEITVSAIGHRTGGAVALNRPVRVGLTEKVTVKHRQDAGRRALSAKGSVRRGREARHRGAGGQTL